MKNAISIILFCISINTSAQISYSFNYKLKIKPEKKSETARSFCQLVNSKALQYNFYVADNMNGDLIDTQRNTVSHIYIDKEDKEFNYTVLDHLKVPNLAKYTMNSDRICIDQIKPDEYSIQCFEKDADSPSLELIASLEPADDDLIRFYNITFDDDLHLKIINGLKEKLNGNFNYYIREYTMKDREGSRKHAIEKPEKVNLNLINSLKEEEVAP